MRCGAEACPSVKVTLNIPPSPSTVSQPPEVHLSAMSTKNTSPLGLTATPNGLTLPIGTGPLTLVGCPASLNQLTALPPRLPVRMLVTAQQLPAGVLHDGSRAMPAGTPAPWMNTVYGAAGTSSPS